MTETLCNSGAVKLKAGANVSTALTAENYTTLINQAESFIAVNSQYDWVTNYGNIDANTKAVLEEAASSHAAIGAINYDMSGYTSRTEAQTMVDINYNKVVDCLNLLRDNKFVTFTINGDKE